MPASFAVSGVVVRTIAAAASALLLSSQAQAQPPPAATPALGRWIDVQNATLNVRYRFVDTSAGTVTTNQLQHRESVRGRLKFDAPGRYALNVGAFSGSRFTSSWNNTGIGLGDPQKTMAVRALYVAAQPVTGVEGQYGGMYIIKGESTEVTTYDDDGYVTGGRLTVRRPRELFLDEISITAGYFTADASEIGIGRRLKYLDETPNYRHVLVGKKVGARAGVSTDFTSALGAHVWRAAANVKTPELRIVDSIVFENYKRTNSNPRYGFAVTADKAVTRRVSINGGYARIDRFYGGLNADRFNIGNRAFVMTTYALSSRFTASIFVTTAVGRNAVLPQRTLSNFVFSYNALPDLRRTGLL